MTKKKIITIVIILTAFILTPILIFLMLKTHYNAALEDPNSSSEEVIEFEIMQGESIDTIIPSLIAQELLREEYRNYFLIYLKTNETIPKIQAGVFQIPQNLTMKELAQTLQTADAPSIWITIPEGLRADEIAQIFSKDLANVDQEAFISFLTNQDFINTLSLHGENITSLEGFLFPDKYFIDKEAETKDVVILLVENFKNKVPKDYNYEDIILASLIEREGINADDRRIISGILQKRLEEQWLLQVDATLLYQKKDWKYVITVQDIEENHEYNTYLYHGLPPTPICNPGLDAISSVFEPKETDYYYYIHYKDEDENIVPGYSENLEEHNSKVQQYLR